MLVPNTNIIKKIKQIKQTVRLAMIPFGIRTNEGLNAKLNNCSLHYIFYIFCFANN